MYYKQEFINKIAPIVCKVNNNNGNILYNSVVIAQAICETGWGTSSLMMKANAVFGIKATNTWAGKRYSAKTKEVYDGKNYIEVTATFKAYNNIEESVIDYFNLIKSSRYKKALNCTSYTECITEIKNAGYATDPNYVNTIIIIIEENKLYEYDSINTIQSLEQIANDVIAGKYGNGEERKQKLGSMYEEVQKIVNEKLKGTTKIESIQVGDKVQVINNYQYNSKKKFRIYYDDYDVIEVNGDRVVIGRGDKVTSAVNINNIKKV